MKRLFPHLLGFVALALFFLLAPQVAHAQDARPGGPTPPGPWVVIPASNGYTVWHKDINSGCSFSDHYYTLDIPADPNQMSDISYTMTNWDVDYNDPQGCLGGPEVDLMYFNSDLLGILTGANNSWSVNSWPLDKSQVVSGTNQIYIDTDAPGTGCWCVGVGWIEVQAKVGFQVTAYTPQADDKNRDFHKDKLDLTVTFSTEYDTSTLTTSTFKLEYRNQSGSWQQVSGSFTQLAPNKFRFTPGADLKDGVRYRATVKGGSGGVKSKAGAELSGDTVWYFWTVPNLAISDNFDYGSGSVCPPSPQPCPGLEIAAFQVARNANMVPGGKQAIARLYLRWKKPTDVQSDDQVKQMEVSASVSVDGQTYSQRPTVKRPDQYTSAELANAGNTINVYHTPSSSFNYSVEVVPQPQTNATPVKYNQTRNLSSSGRSPRIEFDYYFLKDGEWAGGIPASAKTDGKTLFTLGTQLITDLFPVLGTTFHEKSEYSIGYTRVNTTTDTTCDTVWQVDCPIWWFLTSRKTERFCIYEKLETMRGGHPFVAATVPASVCPGANGIRSGNVFLHLSGSGANYGTIAHETGHIYGLNHEDSPNGIEGFQVRTKINRSYQENSGNVVSLMHTVGQPADKRWIDNGQYNTLLGTVTAITAISAQSAYLAGTGPYLIVSGYIYTDTGTAELTSAFLQEVPNNPPSATGTCKIELLNGSGTVLSSDNVTPGPEESVESSVGAKFTGATHDNPYFTVSLLWDNNAQQLRVSCGGTMLLTQARSAHAPTVDFVGLADGATLSGTQLVSWVGNDSDGPELAYQLQFSGDGGITWTPLMPLGVGTSFNLNTALLPSGAIMRLRIMVTDGFDTAYATRTVNLVNPLTVAGVLPAGGAAGVELNSPVQAWFVSDVAEATLQGGGLQLLENGWTAVNGTVSYDPVSHIARFTPTAPLKPNTNYTARLLSTVQDVNGNSLGANYDWSFLTVPDTVPPLVVSTSPNNGQFDVPLNALVQAQFNETMNAGSLTTASFSLQDSVGNLVGGTVIYDAAARAALFVPSSALASNTVYKASLTTSVTDAAGNPLETIYEWNFTTGTMTSNGVRIVGNYNDRANDVNGDGLYDNLAIYVDVEVLTAGTYNLNGRLVDSDGTLLEWQTTGSIYLDRGVRTLALVYSSVPIRSNGKDGPYTLDALNFYNTGNPMLADLQYDAYQTFPYDVTSFYSVLTLGPLPDQILEWNTTRDNAFNLRDYTTHATLPVSSVTYQILINTNPAVGVTIDGNAYVDINPWPNTEAESDVTIEARDPLGNRVTSSFHISVQKARASSLIAQYEPTMVIGWSQPISVEIHDQWDRLYTQMVTVTFETTLGTMNPASVVTSSGTATTTFQAEDTPGTAFITIKADNAELIISIEITELCPATVALGQGAKPDLDLLRQFRDGILATDSAGQRYISLYYQHSPEVVRILLADAGLRSRTVRLLREWMPGVQGLLARRSGHPTDQATAAGPTLTSGRLREIEALLNDVAARASPELQAVIRELQDELRSFQGQTLQDIWESKSLSR